MRRRLSALTALAAAVSLALTGCAGAAEQPANSAQSLGNPASADLTLMDFSGQETTLEAVPQRVVVLEYAALDTLHTLGLDQAVVGVPKKTLPEHLNGFAAESTTDTGALKELDFEAIAAADPDLILIGSRSADFADQLGEIAPTVNVTADTKRFLDSTIERAEDLAGLFGMQEDAKPYVEKIRSSIEDVKSKSNQESAMFLLVSGGKVSAYAPGHTSRYSFIFDELSFTPAGEVKESESGHGQEVSFEFIAEAKPQHLFVLDRDSAIGQSGQAAEAVLDNELVKSTDAAKNGNITYVDGRNWYVVTGGLTTMQTMLDEISGGLK